jgi:uncharacterized membrane protein YedE/YeeE
MTIDWTHFTPGSALAGGLLIGLAAAWLILVEGRILGASGALGGLVPPPVIEADTATLIAGGLMVGFGTRLGAGCTSGHGVCGVARLSPRSLAATATFMVAGFLTVFVVRHLLA